MLRNIVGNLPTYHLVVTSFMLLVSTWTLMQAKNMISHEGFVQDFTTLHGSVKNNDHQDTNVTQDRLKNGKSVPLSPGFAACLIVQDDTIKLYEWIAYHYTMLPLTSLIIAISPESSNHSIHEIRQLVNRWNDASLNLNITLWKADQLPMNYTFQSSLAGNSPTYIHDYRQQNFAVSCTNHYRNLQQEQYLLLTDSDEFVAYNPIMPLENLTHYPVFPESIFQGGPYFTGIEGRKKDCSHAIPIREKEIPYALEHHHTILDFIHHQQQKNTNQTYFPNPNGCTRLVGLKYGTNNSDTLNSSSILLTQTYLHHEQYNDHWSKVMLDVTTFNDQDLEYVETMHNPFPRRCGKNGKKSSGMDFSSAILRLAHYVGSLESWMERSIGNDEKGVTLVRAMNEETWKERNDEGKPYHLERDWSMTTWVDEFTSIVGKEMADGLLFVPLEKQIAYVKKKLNMLS